MSWSNGSQGIGDLYTKATFQALVDAIIPPTFNPAAIGVESVAGAVQLCVDQS